MTNPYMVESASATLSHEALPGVKVYLTYVTPAMAAEWLTRNTKGQRKISPRSTAKYTADMLRLQWQFTGDPVRFDSGGELIDGQHRLTSIISSGVEQLLLVIEGLPHDTMAAIDSGRKRNYSDYLRMQGVSSHTSVSALVNRAWHWDRGNFLPTTARVINAPYVGAIPSVQDLEQTRELWMDEGVDFNAASNFAQSAKGKYRGGAMFSIWGFTWCLYTLVDPYAREEFFFELTSEAKETKPTYAINALRNKLTRTRSGEATDVEWLHFFNGTWNAWKQGREIGILRMPHVISPASLNVPLGLAERYNP